MSNDRRTSGSVLVVEDDADQRAMLADVVRLVTDSVMVAASGEEALAIHQRSPVDVVIADVNLAGMSGVDLLHALSGSAGAGPAPQVLLLTGFARFEGKARELELGGVRWLQKPYDPDRLLRTLRELLPAAADNIATRSEAPRP